MGAVDITLEILNGIGEAFDLGYDRLFVNVDDLEDGLGFLRVLAMKGLEYIIVFEGTFELDVCCRVLEMLEKSEYDITDFTEKWCDD